MCLRMRTNLASLLLILLLALLVEGCSSSDAQESPTPTPYPTPIVPIKPTYEVQRGEVVDRLQFTGRIGPVVEEELFFRRAGRVEAVYAQREEFVNLGDLLAELEVTANLERQLAADQLALQRAEVNLETAELRLEMAKAQPWSSTKEYEIAIRENDVELARIGLEEASLNVEDLEAAIADAQIVAPFDGQILSEVLSEGRVVEAYNPVMVIGDISSLEARAKLGSSEVGQLEVGMPATIAFVSRPGEQVPGQIRRLPYQGGGDAAEDADETTRVAVLASSDEVDFELGDLVRITVELEKKEDALWLPPQAIRTFEGRTFVLIQEGDVQRRVDVSLGIRGDDRVEILEGLTEGQVVIGP